MIQTILVDFYNLYKICESAGTRLETVIGEIMKMGLANGEIQQIRLFVPHYEAAGPWRMLNALQIRYGLAVEACPVLSERIDNRKSEIKDAVDFYVLLWVEKNLCNGAGSDSVIFVTGDGHFLISSSMAKLKGKKVEFWFVNPQSTHQMIKRQEDCREISVSPATTPTQANIFLETLQRFLGGSPLLDDDRRRLEIIAKVAKTSMKQAEFGLSSQLSSQLGIDQSEATELLEAMMVLGIARVYPSVQNVIDFDTSSSLFQMLLTRSKSWAH